MTGFVEWVSVQHIMAGDGRLLQILCVLLIVPEFQMPAAECLLQIVNRKGQVQLSCVCKLQQHVLIFFNFID